MVIVALKAARIGVTTIGFSGQRRDARAMRPFLAVPSTETALIQQIHITAFHAICGTSSATCFRRLSGGRASELINSRCVQPRFDRDGVPTTTTNTSDLTAFAGCRMPPGDPPPKRRGFAFVTNQSGVARGYFTQDDVEKLHVRMRPRTADGAHGSTMSAPATFLTPVGGLRRVSDWRKPGQA